MENEQNIGEDEQGIPDDGILLAWEVPEFEEHERGVKWWVFMILVTLGLIASALLTANFVFAIIIIMAAILLFMMTQRDPRLIPFMITVEGVVIEDRLYPYTDFADFWIIFNPPTIKRLYLHRKRGVRTRITIPLLDIDPNEVRDALSLFMDENLEEVEESISEALIRIAKF